MGVVDISGITAKAKRLIRSITPIPIGNRLFAARFKNQAPPTGRIHWGAFRRTTPISRKWGYDRGTSIYRGYIAEFLSAHSSEIKGCVLEFDEDRYTRQFGGNRVSRSDVMTPWGWSTY